MDDAYTFIRRFHAQPPIYRDAGSGDWFITRYADVVAILRDERFGHPPSPGGMQNEAANSKPRRVLQGAQNVSIFHHRFMTLMHSWLTEIDGAPHTRIRAAFSAPFHPAQIAARMPRLQALADQLMDQVSAAGEIDLIADLIAPFSRLVIAEILGIPTSDTIRLERGAQEIAKLLDEGSNLLERQYGMLGVLRMADYFQKKIAAGEAQLPTGLFAQLLVSQAQGDLNAHELVANLVLLFFAGHATTVAFIANAVRALLANPEQYRWLKQHPELIRPAVEELLRYDSTAQFLKRKARESVALGESKIAKGETVRLWVAAANRDPAQFSAPGELYLAREPNPHVAFALGSHYCLGAPLARAEAQIVISTLLRCYPGLALRDGPLEWATTLPLRGLVSLPVVF